MGNVSHWYAVAPVGISRGVVAADQAAQVDQVAPAVVAEPVVQEAAADRAVARAVARVVDRAEQNAPHRRSVKKCVKSAPE